MNCTVFNLDPFFAIWISVAKAMRELKKFHKCEDTQQIHSIENITFLMHALSYNVFYFPSECWRRRIHSAALNPRAPTAVSGNAGRHTDPLPEC